MEHEEYLTFAEAARILPHKPSPSTVYRWYKKGILCGDIRVHLRARAFGRKLYVTPSDLERFSVDVAEAKRQTVETTHSHNLQRETEIRNAESRLKHLGI